MGNIYEPNDVEAQFSYAITMLFGMLTPILNPILYSMFNENVRKKLDEKCPGGLFYLWTKKQNSPEEFPLNEMGKRESTMVEESDTNGHPGTTMVERSERDHSIL